MTRLRYLLYLFIAVGFVACQQSPQSIEVSSVEELETSLEQVSPGQHIVIAPGIYRDVFLKVDVEGNTNKYIYIEAQEPGTVFFEGQSALKLGGKYVDISGIHFRNGYTPSNAVVDFKINKKNVAEHIRVHDIVIEDYNQPNRSIKDHWVEFWGKHNSLENSYLAGKTNEGPTVRVEIKGNRNINNYHQIKNNYFGPRPRKGGPKAETIQLGDSFSSMSPSHTVVEHNLFDRCNGEVEVISSKTNFNIFKDNVFYMSEGSLVTRHGNYAQIEGNYFLGDGMNPYVGGVRIINTGHVVVNNRFENLIGSSFRSPVAIMNGIPKSPLNRYNQVTDVVISSNTFMNSEHPIQIGVGQNLNQKDVLPSSEIRSAIPIRTEVTNNLIFESKANTYEERIYDSGEGVLFESNYLISPDLKGSDRFLKLNGSLETQAEGKFSTLSYNQADVKVFKGYTNKDIGATHIGAQLAYNQIDWNSYGPTWFNPEKAQEAKIKKTVKVNNVAELELALSDSVSSLELEFGPGLYELDGPINVNKTLSLKAAAKGVILIYSGEKALFQLHSYGLLEIQGIEFISKGSGLFETQDHNMDNHYGIRAKDASFDGFSYLLQAYKHSFAQEISFDNCKFSNASKGFSLAAEVDAKGDYNVEFLTFSNCEFQRVTAPVINYFRGGYDESTIGGNLVIEGSKFENCDAPKGKAPLFSHVGIIQVDINNNTFENNKVRRISTIWTSKNNKEYDNTIINSGDFAKESQVKMKLVY
ncbi:MAG: chondroitinase-B domain-containing protein [Flavobacteriaceae bacterium]